MYYENEDYKILEIAPLSQYNSGEEYTLWIKDLKTINGSGLMEYIKMGFIVE